MNLSDSLLVEITRGTMVESTHHCDVVVADASGEIVRVWGEPDRLIYARSAAKPLQALPLLETGAAERFGYTNAEVAFACASHNSERIHTDMAADILHRIGLDEADLECGPHRPYLDSRTDEIVRKGEQLTRLHNNCSGKHVGFLTTAVHLDEATAGYIRYEHPVQGRITDALCDMTESDLRSAPRGEDGCGIPVLGLPLSGLARAAAKMADPSALGETREQAARRIVHAMGAHPQMVAGTHRMDTAAMRALDGRIALKGGAEGVHIAIVPERGLGIALKARCGEKRASETSMIWVLNELGLLSDSASSGLKHWLMPPVTNSRGDHVGDIRVIGS